MKACGVMEGKPDTRQRDGAAATRHMMVKDPGNFLFAQYYGRAHADVAAMVVISTALSFLTLPLLALFVLQ